VVAVAFQIAFRAEIHANDVFSFLKNYFWHQHIKTIQKVQTALNFRKKKFQNLMKHSYKRNAKRSLKIESFSVKWKKRKTLCSRRPPFFFTGSTTYVATFIRSLNLN
jgi:hypothetical protein